MRIVNISVILAAISGGLYYYVNHLFHPVIYFGVVISTIISVYGIRNNTNRGLIYMTLTTAFSLLGIELLFEKLLLHMFFLINANYFKQYTYQILTVSNLFLIAIIVSVKDKISGRNITEFMLEEINRNKKNKYGLILIKLCFAFFLLLIGYAGIIFNDISLIHKIIIFCVFIFIFVILLSLNKILLSYAVAVVEANIDKNYRKDVNEFIRTLRAQRHDFNFHIESILGMIETGNYEACRNYLMSMLNETKSIAEVMPLKEPAVSALLYTLKETAAAKGIKINYFIYYDMSNINCSFYEINKVLGNLIKNAIDEVLNNNTIEGWINVTILERRNHCIIRVENPIKDIELSTDKFFSYGYSTKINHTGIGLNTVKKIVTDCSGTIFIELDENIITFIVQIPLI